MATAMATRTQKAFRSEMKSITETQSTTLVKNLFRAAFSSVAYVRCLFNDEVFEESSVGGTNYHKLVPSKGGDDVRRYVEWLEEGVFHALCKKYLSTVLLEIYEEADSGGARSLTRPQPKVQEDEDRGGGNEMAIALPDNRAQSEKPQQRKLLEVFSFAVTYPNGTEPNFSLSRSSSRKNRPHNNAPSKQTIKNNTREVLRQLVELSSSLQPLPDHRTISIKLLYTEHTPSDYEPPLFRAATSDSMNCWFENRPLRLSPGKVQTPFHEMSLTIRSAVDIRTPPGAEDDEKLGDESPEGDTATNSSSGSTVSEDGLEGNQRDHNSSHKASPVAEQQKQSQSGKSNDVIASQAGTQLVDIIGNGNGTPPLDTRPAQRLRQTQQLTFPRNTRRNTDHSTSPATGATLNGALNLVSATPTEVASAATSVGKMRLTDAARPAPRTSEPPAEQPSTEERRPRKLFSRASGGGAARVNAPRTTTAHAPIAECSGKGVGEKGGKAEHCGGSGGDTAQEKGGASTTQGSSKRTQQKRRAALPDESQTPSYVRTGKRRKVSEVALPVQQAVRRSLRARRDTPKVAENKARSQNSSR